MRKPAGSEDAPTLTYTVPEAARELRKSRAWGYQAACDGRLPVIRTVAGLRVRRADLLALIGVAETEDPRTGPALAARTDER